MHEVLVNRLGGLSLPRKSVVRLTDRPDMTLDVYRGRKTTRQQQQQQNGFVYGELGRIDYQSHRYVKLIKFWLKVIYNSEQRYIKNIYDMMLSDLELRPMKQNWASLVMDLLSKLGFMEVWISQGVGSFNNF